MQNLFTLNENFTNGHLHYILDILAILAIFCAIFVIVTKNPIVSVLFLIGLFANISFYLILLGLSFIGLSYLIVYIGAVSILFLFILMLINIRISELQSNNTNSIALSIVISISFYYPIFQLLPYNIAILSNVENSTYTLLYNIALNKMNSSPYLINLNNSGLSFVTSKIWDGNLAENSHISAIGNIMYTNYSMWLFISSLILLLAMVGAIVITIKQK